MRPQIRQETSWMNPPHREAQVRGDFNGPAPSVAAGDARASEPHSAHI